MLEIKPVQPFSIVAIDNDDQENTFMATKETIEREIDLFEGYVLREQIQSYRIEQVDYLTMKWHVVTPDEVYASLEEDSYIERQENGGCESGREA